MTTIRSADPLFATDEESRIREWSAACEELTGTAAADAVGRRCWVVIAGRAADGAIVCHPGCSTARLAGEGRPVRCPDLHMRTARGLRRLAISTIALRRGHETVILHPIFGPAAVARATPHVDPPPRLTPRQREILALLLDGVRAKEIAARLTIAETTVRNHIRPILRELGATSQLQAVARARELER